VRLLTSGKLRSRLMHDIQQVYTDRSRVLDSIKADRRLPESRYSPLKLAPKSQNSVFGMMRASNSKQEQG
jgi:hypothetical protein